jgi:protein gp37
MSKIGQDGRTRAMQVPFFFKQWGGFNKKKNGRLLDGRAWGETPEVGTV